MVLVLDCSLLSLASKMLVSLLTTLPSCGLGDIASAPVLLAGLGFIIMAVLDRRGVPGAVIIGILVVSVLAWVTGTASFNGVVGAVPSPEHAFQLDFSMLATAGFIGTAFAFLFVDYGYSRHIDICGKPNRPCK